MAIDNLAVLADAVWLKAQAVPLKGIHARVPPNCNLSTLTMLAAGVGWAVQLILLSLFIIPQPALADEFTTPHNSLADLERGHTLGQTYLISWETWSRCSPCAAGIDNEAHRPTTPPRSRTTCMYKPPISPGHPELSSDRHPELSGHTHMPPPTELPGHTHEHDPQVGR
ncbi:hypothetical protein QBC46DRAFT_409157 [Diplogelasinospora grovesii]|uniref:Uncharacterized protein n=1 Tax=Diplogelasinospora grovesii TaxID=303347 RepID=A0AAN6N642_9PEZI|nr:hypothetical protein QBC46DRAFT_409157 [Diplogelasinospora grovesii]